MEDDYIPQDGDLADGPNGQVMVYRAGAWHQADADGRPVGRIPRPDYGERYYELPNGDIVREGPRGGIEVIERGGGGGSTSGTENLVGADARARFMINLGPLVEAQNTLSRMEGEGYTLDQDWGARIAEGIPFDNGFAGRVVGGSDYNAYQQASSSFEAAILPIMSGAAVTPSEAERQIRAALPQMGDSPEVLAQKARQRAMMINAVAQGIGQDMPFPEVGIWGVDAVQPQGGQDDMAASAGSQPQTPSDPRSGFQTLPGFGGDNSDPSGGRGNPYNYDSLNRDQLQALQPGDYIAGRNEDGTYWRERVYQTPGALQGALPEGAVDDGGGRYRVEGPNGALSEAGAFFSGAAEQIPFGDELAHAAVGALTGDGYSAIRDFDRQQDEIDRELFSGSRNAGGVAGFGTTLALPAGTMVRGTQGAGRLGAAGINAMTGAGYGALYGAGAADDGERVSGAVTGGVTGGVLGPVAQPIARMVGRATTGAGRLIDRASGGQIGEGLSLMTGGRFGGAQNSAAARIREALGRDGIDPQRVADLLDEWHTRGGTDAALMDIVSQNGGGQNFLGLVRASALGGGEARAGAIRYRDSVEGSASDEAINLTRGLTGADRRSVDQARQQFVDVRQARADRDYAGPYQERVDVTDDLVSALQGSDGRQAIIRARRAAEARRDQAQVQDLDALSAWLANPDGPRPQVSAGSLDRVRIAMRNRGESLSSDPLNRDIGSGVFQRASDIDASLDGIEALAPARQRYRDVSQMIEGLDIGRGAYSRPPDDLAAQLSQAPRARDTFGLGMARDIEGAIGRQGDGSTGLFNRLSTAPNATNALSEAFGPQAASRYQGGMGQIVDRVRTARAIDPGFGSQTAIRGQDALVEGVTNLTGGPISFIVRKLNEGLALTDRERQIIVDLATQGVDLEALARRSWQIPTPRVSMVGAGSGQMTGSAQ